MKIEGTILNITARRDGTIVSNIINPSDVEVELEGRNKILGDSLLRVMRKHSAGKFDGLLYLAKLIAYEHVNRPEENNAFCYGVTWNFSSVINSPDVCKKVIEYTDKLKDANKGVGSIFDESEAKSFTHNIPTKTNAKPEKKAEDNINGEMDVEGAKNAIKNMIKFFSEFDFEPNFRFLNTLSNSGKNGISAAKKYITNYFKLIDSPYTNEVVEKMKSAEFDGIINVICDKRNATNKKINNRFELYYGSQGTGKTTAAMKKANGKAIVCHNDMNPSDLMEDFSFDDGKANFHPSALCKAMEKGEVIVLDEINLLPFGSLRFLQGILDGKESFIFKGHEINIKDGFKIIGTMNLSVNGMTYALPSPIVDRCEYIEEYKLNENQLINAIA